MASQAIVDNWFFIQKLKEEIMKKKSLFCIIGTTVGFAALAAAVAWKIPILAFFGGGILFASGASYGEIKSE